MSNNTVVDATNVAIAKCLDFVKSELGCNVDTLKSEYATHMAKRDTFNEIISLDRKLVGSGWACLRDKLTSELYGAEFGNNATLVANSKRLIAMLNDYESWNDERERLESEITKNVDPLRQLVAAINEITGDRYVHKIHATGNKREKGGYECQVFNAIDHSIVENDNPHNIFTSINRAHDTLLGKPVSKKGIPYSRNKPDCVRYLEKNKYYVKFVAQHPTETSDIKYVENESEIAEILGN